MSAVREIFAVSGRGHPRLFLESFGKVVAVEEIKPARNVFNRQIGFCKHFFRYFHLYRKIITVRRAPESVVEKPYQFRYAHFGMLGKRIAEDKYAVNIVNGRAYSARVAVIKGDKIVAVSDETVFGYYG